jgi:hypothetical protein
MKRFVRVMPVLRLLAVFLLLPLGWSQAADWEDGIVLGDDQESTDVSVMVPESAFVPDEAVPLQGVPTESVPLASSPAPVLMAGPGVPYEAPACCPTGRPCPHEALDQPGFIQCLAARKHATWALRADALLLWRNAPPSRPLYSTIVPGTDQLGPTALNANDLNSDMLVAPRLSFLRTDCDGRTLEATYLYAGNFYSDRTLPYVSDGYATSPPGIYGNEWGPPDTNLDSATAKLLGQLQSLEFNSRHCIWADTCQFLIGARWLQWNETLQMSDSFSYAEPSPSSGQDFYDTRCFNNLWGGQIGLDTLLLGRPGMARVEGLVKAGAYYNNAGQNSTFQYVLSDGYTYDKNAGAAGPAACSFVGEVGLTAVLPISCNWDFRCGYFGLWLTNLAQPTRQLSDQEINQFASVGALDTAGSLILQGLSLGLEGRW